MSRWSSQKVLPEDERPARKDGTCFYCLQPIGQYHAYECVIPVKKVLVKYQFTLEEEVPVSWEERQIFFARNESSSCASNTVDNLVKAYGGEKGGRCACGNLTAVEVTFLEGDLIDIKAKGYEEN